MKRLLRKLVANPVVNSFLRTAIRFLAAKSRSLFRVLISYTPVSGAIPFVIDDVAFLLWARGDDALVNRLYYNGGWEKHVTSWFCKLCTHQNNIIDAGANIGFFSILAAKINPNAVVHAFEPNPCNCIRLKKNIALNGLQERVHVHESAVGDTPEPITLFLPTDDRISDVSSVYGSHATFFNDFDHRQLEIPCTTLDAFCENEAFTPDIVKIDVELYELQVMLGMKSVLVSMRPIIVCEIFNDDVKRKVNRALDAELVNGYTLRLQEYLESVGYYFYLIVPAGILHVDSLRLSPDSSMYLLLPVKLSHPFYLSGEADIVLDELTCD